MPHFETGPDTPSLPELILGGIANWVSKFRVGLGLENQLGRCIPSEVERALSDIGLAAGVLSELAHKGHGAADLLQKILVALQVSPDVLEKTDPQILGDLRRTCITCSERKRCVQEVANGTAGQLFRDFCPKAFTFDVLFGLKHQPSDEPWEDISTAPLDCDLELAFIDKDGAHALIFPCRRNAYGWVNVETKKWVEVRPSHWRKWKQTS